MVRMEREVINRMKEGNQRGYGDPMLVSPQVRIATEDRHQELSVRSVRLWTAFSFRARRLSA